MESEKTQGEALSKYIQLVIEGNEIKKKKEREANRIKHQKYINKMARMEVCIEKDLMEQFKVKTKDEGATAAGVIKAAIKKYVSGTG